MGRISALLSVCVVGCLALCAVWSAQALAADQAIRTGPPPAWIKTIPIPASSKGDEGSIKILLIDQQVRHLADGKETYYETAFKVLNSQGLEDAGEISDTWDPELEVLTFNTAEILRDGRSIDLLAEGGFRILRRETNLADATLDGRMTALKEITDLRVGDVVHMATTTRRKNSISGERPEFWTYLNHGGVASRVVFRQLWPKGVKVRWQATKGFGEAEAHDLGAEMELISDHTDVETPEAPDEAPSRFNTLGELELTAFADWREVSSLFSPLYDKAATLSPSSPLKAEAARIRRENPTPEAQTSAALRLVEEQVRYLALAEGALGVVPAAADETWKRRFGDCKGKSALLVALLRELGVKAHAVLADTRAGDALPERLPRVSAFDHVIVRAEINGRIYWLDATRNGDRRIEQAPAPGLKWALPLMPNGSSLERIVVKPAELPTWELDMVIDLTEGLEQLAPYKVSLVSRGLMALAQEGSFAGKSRQEVEKQVRSVLGQEQVTTTVTRLDYGYDEAVGGMRITLEGMTKNQWVANSGVRESAMPAYGAPEFEARPDGPGSDAPFIMDFPSYTVTRFRVKLPQKGEGFSLVGSDVDRTAGGIHIRRTSRITGGEAFAEMIVQTLADEAPYKEALDATKTFASLSSARPVMLRAPKALADAGAAAVSGRTTAAFDQTQADILLRRAMEGYNGKPADQAKALADIRAAYQLAPSNTRILAMEVELLANMRRHDEALDAVTKLIAADGRPEYRAMKPRVLLAGGHFDAALEDAETVLKTSPDAEQALVTQTVALLGLGRTAEAVARADKVIARLGGKQSDVLRLAQVWALFDKIPEATRKKAIDDLARLPDSATARALRGLSLNDASDLAGAREQYDAALKLMPDFVQALRLRIAVNLKTRDESRALADLDRLIRFKSDDASLYLTRAGLYGRADRFEEQMLDLDEAIKLSPGPGAYNERCWARATHNIQLDEALADCDAAVSMAPGAAAMLDSRGFTNFRLKRLEQALQDYNAALTIRPDQAGSLYGRGLVRRALGDARGAETDLARATRLDASVAGTYAKYGVRP